MNKFEKGDKVKFAYVHVKGNGIIIEKATKYLYKVKVVESNNRDAPIGNVILLSEDILVKI